MPSLSNRCSLCIYMHAYQSYAMLPCTRCFTSHMLCGVLNTSAYHMQWFIRNDEGKLSLITSAIYVPSPAPVPPAMLCNIKKPPRKSACSAYKQPSKLVMSKSMKQDKTACSASLHRSFDDHDCIAEALPMYVDKGHKGLTSRRTNSHTVLANVGP